MALPTAGPGVVLKIEDLVPGDSGTFSVTRLEGRLVGNYLKTVNGSAVGVQQRRPGGPDLIEVQTATVPAVANVITLTTQPLRWNTSSTAANAIGGLYEYTATVQVAEQTWTDEYVFRFVLDEDAALTIDGDGNVPFSEVESDTEGVILPTGDLTAAAKSAADAAAVAATAAAAAAAAAQDDADANTNARFYSILDPAFGTGWGDGITSDDTIFAAALAQVEADGGGVIWFPPNGDLAGGKAFLDNKHRWPSHVSLWGAGKELSTIEGRSADGMFEMANDAAGTESTRISALRDICLTATSGHMFQMPQGMSGGVWQNCKLVQKAADKSVLHHAPPTVDPVSGEEHEGGGVFFHRVAGCQFVHKGATVPTINIDSPRQAFNANTFWGNECRGDGTEAATAAFLSLNADSARCAGNLLSQTWFEKWAGSKLVLRSVGQFISDMSTTFDTSVMAAPGILIGETAGGGSPSRMVTIRHDDRRSGTSAFPDIQLVSGETAGGIWIISCGENTQAAADYEIDLGGETAWVMGHVEGNATIINDEAAGVFKDTADGVEIVLAGKSLKAAVDGAWTTITGTSIDLRSGSSALDPSPLHADSFFSYRVINKQIEVSATLRFASTPGGGKMRVYGLDLGDRMSNGLFNTATIVGNCRVNNDIYPLSALRNVADALTFYVPDHATGQLEPMSSTWPATFGGHSNYDYMHFNGTLPID